MSHKKAFKIAADLSFGYHSKTIKIGVMVDRGDIEFGEYKTVESNSNCQVIGFGFNGSHYSNANNFAEGLNNFIKSRAESFAKDCESFDLAVKAVEQTKILHDYSINFDGVMAKITLEW